MIHALTDDALQARPRILLLGGVRCPEPLDELEVLQLTSLDEVPPTGSRRWTVAVIRHERWVAAGKDGLRSFIDALGGLDEAVGAVYVPRIEHSQTGTRTRLVVRAWRGAASLRGPLADLDVEPHGTNVAAQGVEIVAHRWEWRDPRGRAETAEREGDLADAAYRWAALADAHEGVQRAWCHVRAAALFQAACVSSEEAHQRLHQALAASPRLPETLVRLAEIAIARGELDDGLAWGELAHRLHPPHGLAHLEGTSTWLVPTRLALALHRAGDARAAPIAREAMSAGANGALAASLTVILGTVDPETGRDVEAGSTGGGGSNHGRPHCI